MMQRIFTPSRRLLLCVFLLGASTSHDRVTAALVAHFPLDGIANQNTSVIDAVIDDPGHPVTDGTGNNGTAFWVDDPSRGSVLRTPDGNYFSAGTQGINTTLGFTWSFWVSVDSAESSSHSIIGTRQDAWHKLTTASGVDGNGFADFAAGSYDLRDDTWHHIGYVGDSTGARLYIDGVFIGQDTTLVTSNYNGNMQIGGTPSFSETVNALMDDIGIWNEALTVGELISLRDVTTPGFLYGLLYDAAQFDLLKSVHDAGAGSVTIDGLVWQYETGLVGGAGLNGTQLILDPIAGTGLTVPEPSRALLFGLAALGLLRRRR